MISLDNKPLNLLTQDDDFTVSHYSQLLKLAKTGWKLTTYENICWSQNFLLWRHDVDYSLNRSLALAQIESEESVKATYFINPHSAFYNLAEVGQCETVKKILSLGHDLGLHFDTAFYNIDSETTLDTFVSKEADYLQDLFGHRPTAISFHNPTASHFTFDAEEYGGFVNCYSKRFKTEVGYCSDSNGYWRYRRLFDVLKEKKDTRLQVLTHPGWWQEKPIPARQRIFRSVYERASATMKSYDDELKLHNRLNHKSNLNKLDILKEPQPRLYKLCDYLWNTEAFQTLFMELWRFHEMQIYNLSKVYFLKEWKIPFKEVDAVFNSDKSSVIGLELFEKLFGVNWLDVCGFSKKEHMLWKKISNELMYARFQFPSEKFKQGSIYLSDVVQKIAEWGLKQSFVYDGLTNLDLNGLPTKISDKDNFEENLQDHPIDFDGYQVKQWKEFLSKIKNYSKV